MKIKLVVNFNGQHVIILLNAKKVKLVVIH